MYHLATLTALALAACTGAPPPEPEPVPVESLDPDAWIVEEAEEWTIESAGMPGQFTLSNADGPQLELGAVLGRLGDEAHLAGTEGAWDGDTWTGELTDDGVAWTLQLQLPEGAEPVIDLVVTAELTEEVAPQHLALILKVPHTGVRVLGRDQVLYAPISKAIIDPWTPQQLYTDTLSIHGHAQAMEVTRAETATSILLVLDDARLHPFKPLKSCAATMDDPDPAESDHSKVQQPKGTKWTASAEIHLGQAPALQPARYPDGYRSAVVFTDHADQSNVGKLGALLWGEGSLKGQEGITEGSKGMLGHGLSLTKSVFVKRKSYYARQLDNDEYVELLNEAREAGVEVGSHSVTGLRDEPATVKTMLAEQKKKTGPVRTWIDHQPKTNCEALTNSGWNPKSKWYLVPTLEVAGVDYVWAGYDVAPEDGINLFDPGEPGAHTPILYTHPELGDLEVFLSLWRAKDRDDFLADYSGDKLDKLVRDRGLHIAHTYLDTNRPGSFVEKWTLLDGKKGGFTIRDDAEALFTELGRRQGEREIWVSTMAAVGDHLHASRDVSWTWYPTRVHLKPAGGELPGFTVLAPKDLGAPLLDGKPVAEARVLDQGDVNAVIIDLPAEGASLSFTKREELRRPALVERP